MRSDELLSVGALVLATLVGAVGALAVAKRTGRILSFRVLAIVFYVIVNAVSGIFHIIDFSDVRRGYFDAVLQLESKQLLETSLLSLLGLIALLIGVTRKLPPYRGRFSGEVKSLTSRERAVLTSAIILIFPVAFWSQLKMESYAATVDTARIISVSGGLARYVFLSSWLVPTIYFAVVLAASWRSFSGRWPIFLLLLLGVGAIAASVDWTGTRSSAIYLSLPLILVLAPRMPKSKTVATAFVGALGLILVTVALRQNDIRQSKSAFGSTGPADWLDWELGRFSMLGFAVQRVDRYGSLNGETFVNSFAQPLDTLFRAVGIPLFEYNSRSSTEVVAEQLLNSTTATHVVPGLSAEFYLNFSSVGILVGYLLLGRLLGWVDDRCFDSSLLTTQLAWTLAGTLLVRSIGYGSSQVIATLLFTGAPLLFVAFLSFSLSRPRKVTTTVPLQSSGGFLNRNDFSHHNRSITTVTAPIATEMNDTPISRQGADRPISIA